MATRPLKLRGKAVQRMGGFSLSMAIRLWMQTLDYQVVYYDRTVDPAGDDFAGPCIYIFWHDQILFPFYLRGHTNTAMLVSQHADAQWLSEAARHMGFEVVRGSSNRGGVVALRELMRRSRGMNLAVTPDGPRGPRQRLAPGAIYLSSKLQIPLVCVGSAYQNPWRLATWDRFALPKPFTRSRAIVSPPMQIPAAIDRPEVDRYRRQVEAMLNFVSSTAQDWADRGGRYAGQQFLQRRPLQRTPFRRATAENEASAWTWRESPRRAA